MYDLGEGAELGAGRYRLQAALGSGGMATVYRALDDSLGRTVAVKVMRPELARDPAFRQRFRREARLVAGLNHPHVVSVHDIGEHHVPGTQESLLYLVMEYVEGESLLDRLARGPLPTEDALRCAVDILEGLGASHAQGIVHRDVKPANVMITSSGWCKVLDFGIAWAAEGSPNLTAEGRFVGSPPYMAPEQVVGEATDGRTDVYAVGVVLFELLSGRTPFGDAPVQTLLARQLQQAPPTLAEVGVRVPRAVQDVITRALAKDPRDRFEDAHLMSSAIGRILERGGARTHAAMADVRRRGAARVAEPPRPVRSSPLPPPPVAQRARAAGSPHLIPEPLDEPYVPYSRTASRFGFWAGLAGIPLFSLLYHLVEEGVSRPPVAALALTSAVAALVGLICSARALSHPGCGPGCRHGMAGWGVFLNLMAAAVWFAWLLGMAGQT